MWSIASRCHQSSCKMRSSILFFSVFQFCRRQKVGFSGSVDFHPPVLPQNVFDIVTGRWSHGPHLDKHSTPSRSHKEVQSEQKTTQPTTIRKEDLLREHQQILSHLDSIMLRAKAAISKSSQMEKEMGIVDLSPRNKSGTQSVEEMNDETTKPKMLSQIEQSPQSIPVSVRSQANTELNTSQAKENGPSTPRYQPHPSISDLRVSNSAEHRAPMTDQLRLAEAQLRNQEQLIRIQEQQLHSLNYGSALVNRTSSEFVSQYTSFAHGRGDFDYSNSQGLRNAYSHAASVNTEHSEKLPPQSNVTRKPKMSTDITKTVHKKYEDVLPKDNVYETHHLDSGKRRQNSEEVKTDKPLPSAEVFLKSLAEMKLRKSASGASEKAGKNSSIKLDAQQLVQLGEHFKKLGIDTRPFQDLLGSPSNTRDTPVSSQPAELQAKRQLTFPEDSVEITELQRDTADGEENANSSQPVLPTTSNSVQQSTSENSSSSIALVTDPPSKRMSLPQSGAISISDSAIDLRSDSASSFTPIDSYPITDQTKPKGKMPIPSAVRADSEVEETETKRKELSEHEVLERQVSGETNPPSPTRNRQIQDDVALLDEEEDERFVDLLSLFSRAEKYDILLFVRFLGNPSKDVAQIKTFETPTHTQPFDFLHKMSGTSPPSTFVGPPLDDLVCSTTTQLYFTSWCDKKKKKKKYV